MEAVVARAVVAIELRAGPISRRWLTRIADILRKAGFQVVEWRGPVRICGAAIVWNGKDVCRKQPIREFENRGVPILFRECGGHPQLERL